MTRKAIRKLIDKSEGRICVRYPQPLTPTYKAAPPLTLHRLARRTSVFVAGAFSAGLGLATTLANGPYPPAKEQAELASAVAGKTQSYLISGAAGGTIRGIIFDPNGVVIPRAYVSVINTESAEQRSTISDGRGEYRFTELEAGFYNLRIQVPGFSTSEVSNISLRANEEDRIDQTLSIAAVEQEEGTVTFRHAVMGGGSPTLPTEPLVKAANEDDLEAFSQALLTTPNPNIRDRATDLTALECAVRNANHEMVQTLLWAKADVNLKDISGQTVLMMLGEKATSDIVWDLLNAGAKINARDDDGDSALIEAAQINNLDLLKTLLDAGAQVNISNNDGCTALMAAASEGLVNNVKALLQAGADPDARDKKGRNALSYAKQNDSAAVIRLLRSYGAIEVDRPEDK
jgi:hypothetical protein